MGRAPIRRVGVVGLGRMGLPMARHLVRAGFTVLGFDLDAERGAALADLGGSPASGPGDLARRSEAILVMVADDAQVLDAALGPGGVLDAAAAGTALVISSTVRPGTCARVAAAAAGRGVAVIDAPVARGARGAEAGTLTAYVGGERAAFERCLPVLRAFCSEVVHIAERVGSGQVAKLANNMLLWAGVVAAHEALSLGARLGVPPGHLRRALLRGSADSWALRELHLINLTWPQKDLDQAMEVAGEAGFDLPLADHVRALIERLTRADLRRLVAADDDTEGE